jgi:hypothetical protein
MKRTLLKKNVFRKGILHSFSKAFIEEGISTTTEIDIVDVEDVTKFEF